MGLKNIVLRPESTSSSSNRVLETTNERAHTLASNKRQLPTPKPQLPEAVDRDSIDLCKDHIALPP